MQESSSPSQLIKPDHQAPKGRKDQLDRLDLLEAKDLRDRQEEEHHLLHRGVEWIQRGQISATVVAAAAVAEEAAEALEEEGWPPSSP